MKKLKYKKPIAAILIFLLLFTGCYVFDFVKPILRCRTRIVFFEATN